MRSSTLTDVHLPQHAAVTDSFGEIRQISKKREKPSPAAKPTLPSKESQKRRAAAALAAASHVLLVTDTAGNTVDNTDDNTGSDDVDDVLVAFRTLSSARHGSKVSIANIQDRRLSVSVQKGELNTLRALRASKFIDVQVRLQ